MGLALEHAPVGILMVNRGGVITLANRHAEALFAYDPGALKGQPLDDLVPHGLGDVHARHRAAYFERPVARAMGAGRELFGQRSDGTSFPLEIGLSPVPTLAGTMVMAVV
ncbi:MAG: PAS domain S-box protein, partial [Myxococcales bacterium]|nr:PAS domain S-box protein [Myxococcales bacterium]